MSRVFHCFMIGEDNLLIQCADILLTNGHKINGIISADPAVQKSSLERNIPYYRTLKEAHTVLENTAFDCLFSVASETILPEKILNLPRLFAINLHHAPLPQYAGMNVVSWAILNNEKSYGITWHLMNKEIDEGDILCQRLFSIEHIETAVNLYLKCYEEALLGFKTLLNDLENNTLSPKKQNLPNRSYYPLSKKPHNDGIIDWNTSAEAIIRLFHATHLGHIKNLLTLTKVLIGDQYLIPQHISRSTTLSVYPAGSLTQITSTSIHVATLTYDIILKELKTLDGIPCPINLLLEKNLIKLFEVLPSISESTQSLITQSEYNSYRFEKTWVAQLQSIETLSSVATSDKINPYKVSTKIKTGYFHSSQPVSEVFLISLFMMVLYKINNYTHQTIALSLPNILPEQTALQDFFSPFVPLQCPLSPEHSFAQITEEIDAHVMQIYHMKSFRKEVLSRYPALSEHLFYETVALMISPINSDDILENRHPVTIYINPVTQELSIFSTLQDPNHPLLLQLEHFIEIFSETILTVETQTSTPLNQLSILPYHLFQQVVQSWNNTSVDFSEKNFFLNEIKKHAKNTPEKIALEFQETKISYHELIHAVIDLSEKIRGVIDTQADFSIAFCLERGVEFVISILAIVYAGGSYIPLDPKHPPNVRQYILDNATPHLLICNNQTLIDLHHSIPHLQYHYTPPTIPVSETEYPHADIAYLIYTSGSSGKPKGVKIQHPALHNFLWDMYERLNLNALDRWLAITTPTFDIANLEIFLPLMAGASLIIAQENVSLMPTKLADILETQQITFMQATPTTWQLLNDNGWQGSQHLSALCGGDYLKEDLAEDLCLKIKSLFQVYGPTETTIWSTAKQFVETITYPLTIGKPIANTAVFILDNERMPLPLGSLGEIYIAGKGLAQGYHHALTLTNEAFIPNPFYPEYSPYSRMYKTGDLGYWNREGEIIFIGRKDFQIKLNGHRIELNTIDYYLNQCPLIQSGISQLYENKEHVKQIIAYIVPHAHKETCLLESLQAFLSEHLPTYMIPSAFYVLDKFPLTHNLKIDRKNLPSPDDTPKLMKKNYQPAQTATEKKLLSLWESILHISPIGIHDNFFSLGGTSLLVTKVILAIETIFQSHISLYDFFSLPTIAQLAKILEKNEDNHQKNPIHEKTQRALQDFYLPTSNSTQIKNGQDHILLTGSTGFVGSFLLEALLKKHPDANIYCLIRAKDPIEARNKLIASHRASNISLSDSALKRVHTIVGCLNQPLFGLTENAFFALAEKIDVIYHNAAAVHHLYDYEQLKTTNVEGTKTILALATHADLIPIHYISTLSAASKDESGNAFECLPDDNPQKLANGYAVSKWMAEYLLVKAQELLGLPIKIYRAPWVMGESTHGYGDIKNNQLLLLIQGCLSLGVFPDWNIGIDIVPVDFLCEAIVNLAEANIKQTIFNCSHPVLTSWKQLIAPLIASNDSLRLIPADTWKKNVSISHLNGKSDVSFITFIFVF